MKHSFEKYKDISTKVLDVLIENDCFSIQDIDIIYNLIIAFPYCIDGKRYIYNWDIYDSMELLPLDALLQLENK